MKRVQANTVSKAANLAKFKNDKCGLSGSRHLYSTAQYYKGSTAFYSCMLLARMEKAASVKNGMFERLNEHKLSALH